jgi:4-hydroxy-tetrahydrodipicolinate reductase
VLVDFTIAESALTAARIAAKNKVNLVIGTSGLSQDNISEIGNLAKSNRIGAVVAPNFALGAVLMMHLVKIAAKYFDYAEIIEAHNHEKADVPSGTALATAHDMVQSRGKPFSFPMTNKMNLENARGGQVDGVSIHSVRLPGLVANQEVIFGGPGQTLSIKHYTINRECFMPGVLLAIRKVVEQQGLIYGLENLLNLGGV